jgi:hypothetical protein
MSQQTNRLDCHYSLTSKHASSINPESHRREQKREAAPTSPSQKKHEEGYAFPPAVASASAQRPTATRSHAQDRFCSAMKQ